MLKIVCNYRPCAKNTHKTACNSENEDMGTVQFSTQQRYKGFKSLCTKLSSSSLDLDIVLGDRNRLENTLNPTVAANRKRITDTEHIAPVFFIIVNRQPTHGSIIATDSSRIAIRGRHYQI